MILFHFLYNLSFLILSLFLFYNLFQNSLQSIISGKYPKAKILSSGNYFIIYDKGINIYNKNFSLNKSLYNFTAEEIIENNDYEKTVISDFKSINNYYILCLIKGNFLFIFEDNTYKLKKIILGLLDNETKYYNLIPYKYNESSFQYIISFIFKENNILKYNFLYYNVDKYLDFEALKNTLITKKTYNKKRTCDDGIRYVITNFSLPTQITFSEYGKLTCFFSLYGGCLTDKVILKADNYNIDNDFKIQMQNSTYDSIDNIEDIKSSFPNNEKNV